ncbi:protein dhs-3-like [Sabethes cyaneus]|uniref:protein dhs-3-like n=1 Tax=Sabethes cyaneus TaxID=53552 RepID=UPI00237E5E82|nr:protein dhs-3-like [Sabethes cyaneus]
MIERRKGHIVAIASVASFLPLGRMVSYVATKFGVHGLMESLRDEIQLEGLENQIQLTTVYPFFMNTRKDLMSGLARINVIKRVPIFSPKLVARTTVNGVVHNEPQIFVPKFSGALLKRYVHIPSEIRQLGQTLVFRSRLPKMMD